MEYSVVGLGNVADGSARLSSRSLVAKVAKVVKVAKVAKVASATDCF